jgi:hypothetical protein
MFSRVVRRTVPQTFKGIRKMSADASPAEMKKDVQDWFKYSIGTYIH